MTPSEAKQILELYRPGIDDNDLQVREALSIAEQDAELRVWLEHHKQMQATLREKFRGIAVPSNLRTKILTKNKVLRPQFGSPRLLWIAAAASVVLLIGVAIFWQPGGSNQFAEYQNRMVRGALREYRMDLLTNDLAQVRLSMASRGAPSEFSLPNGLSRLQVVGGGALKWRNNPVTMVCFDRGDKQMLFFFVLDRLAVKDAPAAKPRLTRISKLQTLSWSDGDKVYILAGPDEKNFEKYL